MATQNDAVLKLVEANRDEADRCNSLRPKNSDADATDTAGIAWRHLSTNDNPILHSFYTGNAQRCSYGGKFLSWRRNSTVEINRAVADGYLNTADSTVVNGLVYFDL